MQAAFHIARPILASGPVIRSRPRRGASAPCGPAGDATQREPTGIGRLPGATAQQHVAPDVPEPFPPEVPEPFPKPIPEPFPPVIPEPYPQPTPEPFPPVVPEPYPHPMPEPFPPVVPEPFPQPMPEPFPGTDPEVRWVGSRRRRSSRERGSGGAFPAGADPVSRSDQDVAQRGARRGPARMAHGSRSG